MDMNIDRADLIAMSYAQLMEFRNQLMQELVDFEKREMTGFRNVNDWDNLNGVNEQYEENLGLMKELINIMREKYNKKTLMIESGNPIEQIRFITSVIWADPNDKENLVPDVFKKGALKMLAGLIKDKNPAAMNIRGAMYAEGNQVVQDIDKAFYWYKKGADAGDSLAMSNVGFAYYYGNGVKKNIPEAYKYWSMAAELGEWDAYIQLGDMYMEGVYVPQNEYTAFNLYKKCCMEVDCSDSNEAFPNCLVRLGECYLFGKGTQFNPELARRMFEDAFEMFKKQIARGNYYAPMLIERVKKNLELMDSVEADLADD